MEENVILVVMCGMKHKMVPSSARLSCIITNHNGLNVVQEGFKKSTNFGHLLQLIYDLLVWQGVLKGVQQYVSSITLVQYKTLMCYKIDFVVIPTYQSNINGPSYVVMFIYAHKLHIFISILRYNTHFLTHPNYFCISASSSASPSTYTKCLEVLLWGSFTFIQIPTAHLN